ncbi:MAG: phosphoglucosamine mutase [Armatimonadetes bacterium]|nr:phosphoglucosamine mutase [Armatimonadota bacterium]
MGGMFGTDGVRGVANRDLTPELALQIGRAGAYVLAKKHPGAPLVIGRDTRISGDMLEAALIAGICSAGVRVLRAGVLPTPAVAYLTRALGAAGGVVISASHNPVADNGIKFFGPDGFKLPDFIEEEIELLVNCRETIPLPVGPEVGCCSEVAEAGSRYLGFLKEKAPVDLSGLKVVADCANGAASSVLPELLRELGADVVPLFHRPNGVNINAACGSTYPQALREAVLFYKADLGLACDGDADRLIAVDERGNVVDGDQIMVICGRDLKAQGRLKKNTVVVTVMSNLGLHLAFRQDGIQVLETMVGDRYVLEELLKSGAAFGGEQSGHILFLDDHTTGDGLLTALKLLAVVVKRGAALSELAAQMERLPQLLKNVPVADKQKVMASPFLQEAIRRQEQRLNGQGRILVRPSGTEPLIRVMAEGRDPGQLRLIVEELIQVIQKLA